MIKKLLDKKFFKKLIVVVGAALVMVLSGFMVTAAESPMVTQAIEPITQTQVIKVDKSEDSPKTKNNFEIIVFIVVLACYSCPFILIFYLGKEFI